MSASADARGSRGGLYLLTAVGTALVNLPNHQVPVPWLLAFTLPAAGLGFVKRWPERPMRRAFLGLLAQFGACWAAYAFAGALDQKAALACTILPPMVFVAVRQKDSDAALGLFLSFCTLLVGVILAPASLPLLALYVAAATVALRCDARGQVLAQRQRTGAANPAHAGAPLASGLLLAVLCAAISLAVARSLELLPSPSQGRQPPVAAGGAARTAGLSETFALDGGGRIIDLQGDRLLMVTAEGRPVGDGLYLRSAFFDESGLDAWGVRPFRTERRDPIDRELRLRAPLPGTASITLAIERLANARDFVFVPPGAQAIRGIDTAESDSFREWFGQPTTRTSGVYEVLCQDLPPPIDDHAVDPRAADNGLLELPLTFDRAPFERLLAEWQPRGSPIAKAARIAAGLQARCSYRREEPVGPHRHALLNFLFADQDRHGYCMHFASAGAILLRMAGVPCRIGVGLFGGDPDPNTPGGRVFGSRHAHAWVEIPFAGRGWWVFDPTPAAERTVRSPPVQPETGAAAESAASDGGSTIGDLARRIRSVLARPWPWAALLAITFVMALRPRRRRHCDQGSVERTARPARKLLLRILRELEQAGLPRIRGQTLERYLDQPQLRGGPTELRSAFATYQEVRFGGRPWNIDSQTRMAAGLAAAVELRRAAPEPSGANFTPRSKSPPIR